MIAVYCCGPPPTAAAFARHLSAGSAVVICTSACKSADALFAEQRSRK